MSPCCLSLNWGMGWDFGQRLIHGLVRPSRFNIVKRQAVLSLWADRVHASLSAAFILNYKYVLSPLLREPSLSVSYSFDGPIT